MTTADEAATERATGFEGGWPGRVVVVTPHPDDELWLAGTLALAARAGAAVELTCLTRGEAGTDYLLDRPGGRLSGEALAAERGRELAACAEVLGLAAARAWDLPDGRLADVDDGLVVPRLAACMAGAGLVLGLGRDGVYGHRDHVATTRWIERALHALTLDGRAAPPSYGVVFAPGIFDTTWSSFVKRRPTLAVPDWITSGRGTPEGHEAARVDIGAVEDVKRRAIRAHRSQLRGADEAAFFVPGTLVHMLGRERFERLGPRA